MRGLVSKIAICITTHNRYNVFNETYSNIQKHLPDNGILIVVDDASDTPVPEASFRFNDNVGIARAKNKCLELAEIAGATHIFLFDDDTYPIVDNWHKPYIESSEPHLMYIFKDFIARKLGDTKVIYTDDKLVAYDHPRGCMLYVHASILPIVGGMDIRYGKWGWEHGDYSNRIFNAGLTSFRFADVHSKGLFYSGDEHEAVSGSVPQIEKSKNIRAHKDRYDRSFTSTEYCEYK
jgi:glycosyltransferase involved in cell wall biosynthesis